MQSPALPTNADQQAEKREFWFKMWDKIIPTATVLIAVIGGLCSAWSYLDQRRDEIQKASEAKAAEQHQERFKYALQLRKEKAEMYRAAVADSAKIVSARRLKDAREAIDEFRVYYFGWLHLEKDPKVQQAKVEFGNILFDSLRRDDEAAAGPALHAAQEKFVQACQDSIDLERAYKDSERPVQK